MDRLARMQTYLYSFFIALKRSSNKQPSGKRKKNIKKTKNDSRGNLGNSFYAGRLWDNVHETCKHKLTQHSLRPNLPEDQAGVIHAISPFWMELCQI